MSDDQAIQQFLDGSSFAVVGASKNREKYGNKVLRSYLQNGMKAFPINPNAAEIEGQTAYSSLADLPENIHGLSIITPPAVTQQVVEQAIQEGIKHIWMQPGAESDEAISLAESSGINVIAGGPCILVALQFRDV